MVQQNDLESVHGIDLQKKALSNLKIYMISYKHNYKITLIIFTIFFTQPIIWLSHMQMKSKWIAKWTLLVQHSNALSLKLYYRLK